MKKQRSRYIFAAVRDMGQGEGTAVQGERRIQAQVAVVGGGPVGMLVAAELAAHGVDTVVLESEADVSERPKATTLHARAVQCLARRGHLPAPAAPYSRAAAASPFHFAGLPGLIITAPENEPEPILKCPQAQLERLFEGRARAEGARILREHRVTGVSQEPDGVRITAEGAAGPAVCTARYVVGADGARSMVRQQAGIGSETHPATVSALMGVVTLADPDALAEGWHRTPRGWIAVKRDPEGRTHIRTLDCTGAHADRHLPPTLEELRREVSWITGREIAMEEPRWLSRFSDFTRLAKTFRAGRVFLVGDAAHVHFPIGGQGLSTGVLDALNLGWKLALAVRGGGPGPARYLRPGAPAGCPAGHRQHAGPARPDAAGARGRSLARGVHRAAGGGPGPRAPQRHHQCPGHGDPGACRAGRPRRRKVPAQRRAHHRDRRDRRDRAPAGRPAAAAALR